MAHKRLHIYVPDDTLEKLDAQRGPTTRSAWITHLIDNTNSATVIHTHQWNKKNEFLDVCIGCSEERPHILGTR